MPDKSQVSKNVLGPIIKDTLTSWQMVFTVVFTLLLIVVAPSPVAGWQPWFWLIAGLLAGGVLLYSNLTDADAVEEALARQFESQYDLSKIRNYTSRKRLKDAMEYRHNMLTLAKQARGTLRTHLKQTVEDVNDWIAHMYNLAEYIDAFEGNELVKRDRREVPRNLEKTRRQLDRETSPDVRKELERQIAQLEQQMVHLDSSTNSVRRAEIQLENTLSSLGTIYAQMAHLRTKAVDSASAQRLRLEIQDEVASLQDTLEAMDEVHAQSLRLQ